MLWQELFEKGKVAGFKKLGGILVGVFVLVGTVTLWTGGKEPRHSLAARGEMKKHAEQAREFAAMHAPLHTRFAAASLSINEHENKKALEESLALEKELRNRAEGQQEPLLHAFTLVRIAFLYQSLGDIENEKNAWKTVQNQAGWDKADAAHESDDRKGGSLATSMALVEKNFSCEGSGLRDYVHYRLAEINLAPNGS